VSKRELLSLMCEENGFIFVRLYSAQQAEGGRGSNVPAFDVRFFLLCGLFTTLSAVKPRVSRNESVNA
jgi:hypothetical protein